MNCEPICCLMLSSRPMREPPWRKTADPVYPMIRIRGRAGSGLIRKDLRGGYGELRELREGPHRERPHPCDLDRHRVKPEARRRQRLEIAEVLDDRDPHAEEDRVHGSRLVVRVVDVVRVDSDDRGAALHEESRGGGGQMGGALKVRGCSPPRCPACMNEHGLAADLFTF